MGKSITCTTSITNTTTTVTKATRAMLFKPDATVESDRAADAICTRALACFKDDRSARGAFSEGCTRKYLHIGACVVCTVGGVHGDGAAGRRAALATQQGDCAAVKAPVASRQRDSAASLFLIKRAARREAHIATIPAVPSTSRKDHNSTVREAGRAGTWWWKRRGETFWCSRSAPPLHRRLQVDQKEIA